VCRLKGNNVEAKKEVNLWQRERETAIMLRVNYERFDVFLFHDI